MTAYESFEFVEYVFDEDAKTLTLCYSIDDVFEFTEKYRFGFDFVDYDPAVLDRAVQILFWIAGVSYYKTFLPPMINLSLPLDAQTAEFLQRTYEKGLGEFFYVNQLDPRTHVPFSANHDALPALEANTNDSMLVGLGGGKDSLLSVELLRSTGHNISTWSLNHRTQLEPLVERVGLQHFWVEREWDPSLAELNKSGAYNGHVPISAIFAAVGTIVSVLTGTRDHVVSNEQSANEPTLEYQGVSVNHQYSKSQAFERDFQALLSHHFGDSVRYYSLLRPLSELRIAELFAADTFAKYRGLFSSCNRAYTKDSPGLFWDGTCSKCAFVYLMLAPFVDEHQLGKAVGHNLLLDESLWPTYEQLLGIAGDKPLECVGEIQESRTAMRMMQNQYPELRQLNFEVPESYDFRALRSHEIPAEVFTAISPLLATRL